MTVQSNHWSPFEGGETIGKRGSENGVILEDEEYASGARITLEGSAEIAPFAITCGCYGLFFHTRFFSTEEEARREFSEMKVELDRMVDLSSETAASDGPTSSILMAAAGRFVDRFPT
jgi:hypothetical protein